MTHRFMNDGAPLTEGKYEGQIGVTITFDDGGTQNVYAANKDELFSKVMSMYGNTRQRNRELQQAGKPKEGPPAPVVQTKLTPDQRLAVVENLNDPEKAGAAVVQLVKDATGIDLEAQRAEQELTARIEKRRLVCEEFVANTPDWFGSKRNAALLRDRVIAMYGIDDATPTNYAEAYDYLKGLGVLESAPADTRNTEPEGTAVELSAPPPQRPTGTGAPPSRLRAATAPPPAQRETLEDILRLDPSEHERRLRNEPGYAEKVQRLYEQRTA